VLGALAAAPRWRAGPAAGPATGTLGPASDPFGLDGVLELPSASGSGAPSGATAPADSGGEGGVVRSASKRTGPPALTGSERKRRRRSTKEDMTKLLKQVCDCVTVCVRAHAGV
jgi:hypothetical protein